MVGKKIKELAEREKMTATKLASLLGVTRPAVSAIYEKEDVSTAIVKQCAKIFGVPISYFFDEIKDVTPTSRQYGHNQTSHINIAKLNKIIESSDLTKTQIADKCNISRTTLDNVLYGADAKLSTIERITEVIGISVADLYSNHLPAPYSKQNPPTKEFQSKIDDITEMINYIKAELITSRRQLEIKHNFITFLEKQLTNFDNSTGVTTINSKQNNETK